MNILKDTLDSPAAFRDDHLGAELVKLLPELLALEGDLGIVDDPVLLGMGRHEVGVRPGERVMPRQRMGRAVQHAGGQGRPQGPHRARAPGPGTLVMMMKGRSRGGGQHRVRLLRRLRPKSQTCEANGRWF
jgi:hypothetical protein